MSNETQQWLNENVLVGFTAKRGNAWHWRQGTNNHYQAEIPVDEVRRRLFDWEPVKAPTFYVGSEDANGIEYRDSGEYVYLNNKTRRKLCATTETHKVHGYSDWLIQNVQNIMDDSVQVGSAGLLKGGAVAWVQIEFPESRSAAQGVEYRPTILATTSLDGSLATTYRPVNTIVVCDNTLAAAHGEQAGTSTYKIRHTSGSSFKVLDARERIGVILEKQAETFEAEISRLVSQEVTDKQFSSFLDRVNPIPVKISEEKPGRAWTVATNKRERLLDMWAADPRVAIWRHTAWGVLQLMNTWGTHERKFKGNKAESMLMATVTGKSFEADARVRAEVERVLQDV